MTASAYKDAAAADNTQVYYEIKGYFYHGYNHMKLQVQHNTGSILQKYFKDTKIRHLKNEEISTYELIQ